MPATDDFVSAFATLVSPVENAAAVTPNDDDDLTNVTRQIYVGTGGDVALITKGGDTVTFTNVQGGSLIDIRATRILSTDTTASNIIALW